MALIGFLSPDHLRLQEMSDGTFELVLAAVVVFVALIHDVGAAMLAAALNNGDTFDELVHGVLPGRGIEISVAARFDSICVPPEDRFARPLGRSRPGAHRGCSSFPRYLRSRRKFRAYAIHGNPHPALRQPSIRDRRALSGTCRPRIPRRAEGRAARTLAVANEKRQA